MINKCSIYLKNVHLYKDKILICMYFASEKYNIDDWLKIQIDKEYN